MSDHHMGADMAAQQAAMIPMGPGAGDQNIFADEMNDRAV
jgi:hypothetical protein